MPPFAGVPSLAVGAGGGIESPVQGGCGSVYYLTDLVGEDTCGPLVFDAVLASKPVLAGTAQSISLTAPPSYACSAALRDWPRAGRQRSHARAPSKGVEDDQAAGIPQKPARVLASGLGPNENVSARTPSKAGDYVIQLACPMARDGWTFVGGFFYWLIRVQ